MKIRNKFYVCILLKNIFNKIDNKRIMEFEVEIINEIKEEPEVDVFLMVYQHAPYLRQAIESILMQKTKYKYRIMAFDDCSSDGSQDILREYQKRYPEKIFLALCKQNSNTQYIKQVLIGTKTAKYVCHLEGDDYWINPLKIERQVSFLERHQEFIGVAGNVMNINEDGTKQHCDFDLYHFEESHIFTKEHVLNMKMVAHVSTLLYRNYRQGWTKQDYDRYFNCSMNGDQKISAVLGMLGDVYFSHEVYTHHRRVFTGDSWTARTRGKNITEIKIKMWKDLKKYIYESFCEEIKIENSIRFWQEQNGKNCDSPDYVDERTKQRNIINMFDMWILANSHGITVESVLERRGINTVAIYGMSDLGKRLYYELYKSKINVEYCIDKYCIDYLPFSRKYAFVPINEEKVDAIIVTALTTFDEIKKELNKSGYNNALALDDLLYEMIPEDCILSE